MYVRKSGAERTRRLLHVMFHLALALARIQDQDVYRNPSTTGKRSGFLFPLQDDSSRQMRKSEYELKGLPRDSNEHKCRKVQTWCRRNCSVVNLIAKLCIATCIKLILGGEAAWWIETSYAGALPNSVYSAVVGVFDGDTWLFRSFT